MARHEHEAQEIVAHVVVVRSGQRRECRVAVRIEVTADLLVLSTEGRPPAQPINRPVLRDCHQPGRRVPRHALGRPLLECRDERVLGELLGHPDVADGPSQGRDEPRRLDPPHRIDRADDVASIGRQLIVPPMISEASSDVMSSLGTSATCRTSKIVSIPGPRATSIGQRLAHSIASSSDATSMM